MQNCSKLDQHAAHQKSN